MGKCKQQLPENLSDQYLCVYELGKMCVCGWVGGDQSFPERIPDYPPTEGNNQKEGGRTQEKRERGEKKKRERKRRQLFI